MTSKGQALLGLLALGMLGAMATNNKKKEVEEIVKIPERPAKDVVKELEEEMINELEFEELNEEELEEFAQEDFESEEVYRQLFDELEQEEVDN